MNNDFSEQDLVDYLSGDLKDDDLRARIARASDIEGSRVRQWMDEMARRARDPFGLIDWRRVANAEENQGEAETQLAPVEDCREGAVEHVRQSTTFTRQRRTTLMSVVAAASLLIVVGVTWALLSKLSEKNSLHDALAKSGKVVRRGDKDVDGLEAYPEPWRQIVFETVSDQSVSPPERALEFVTTTMGDSEGATYLSPVNTVVRETRPTFRWRSFGPGRGYRVSLLGSGIVSPVLENAEWAPENDLDRGAVYVWEVAIPDGTDVDLPPDARRVAFRVLPQADLDSLKNLESEAKGSHLLLGTAYKEYGLLDDALREFRALANDNPNSELAKTLLQSMENLR